MKFITLLPVLGVACAFVIPDAAMTQEIVAEGNKNAESWLNKLATTSDVLSHVGEIFKDTVESSQNALDAAFSASSEACKKAKNSIHQCHKSMTAFDAQGWIDSGRERLDLFDSEDGPHHPHHPPHHRRPHHPHKSNMTVYELIAKSKYTTKLAKLINDYPDLVDELNSTSNKFTIFAPTDKAFEKIPRHHKPSKEIIKKILSYHVSPDFYPAGRVLVTSTIPTVLKEEALGDRPQRLRVGLTLRGLTINFFSHVVAANIFGTNGVVHGVDHLILPPPPASKIIEFLPGEFSTLELALQKTGLAKEIPETKHTGGTLFAPSNRAFQWLGPKINAFLFSKYGEKYLKALLQYHIVPNQTLYSDAFYKNKDGEDNVDEESIPKGVFHVDLPTALEGNTHMDQAEDAL